MILGRSRELAVIGRMLARARSAHGSGLVLRGEAGIGKSALLTEAEASAVAAGIRVLRVVGVESESTLTYAALHQLLLPVRERVDRLPGPQADALRTAFGIAAGPPTQPFLVSVAALTLLSDLAMETPLLIAIDDAQWCDAASLDAFAFVARRLEAESIALLLAIRDGAGRDVDAAGLAELRLRGLDDATAAELLGDRVSPTLLPALVGSTGGNPLALVELADRLGEAEELPLADRLEQAFLERVRRIGPDAATLLVAAAAGTSGIAAVERAAAYLGVDPAVLHSPAVADVLRFEDDGLAFRHPLMLSAVYGSAPPDALRAVHDALARALADDPEHAERRTWHRAKASAGPDEEVAAELERAAGEALHRSGYLAAAAAMERAAELTGEPGERARRLTGAADAAWRGGDTTGTLGLLDRVHAAGRVGLEARYLRGSVELRAGSPAEAVAILVPAARDAVAVDPALALRILLLAREAVFTAAQPEAMDALGQTLRLLPDLDRPADRLVAFLLGAFLQPRADAEQAGSVAAALTEVEASADPELLLAAGGMAWAVGEYGLSTRLRGRAVARARAMGAAGTLALTLEYIVPDEISRGDYAAAEALADEGLRLAEETGRRNSASLHLALLSTATGLRGKEAEAGRMAEQALSEAVTRRLVKVADVAQRSLGLLALAGRRPEDALVAFEKLDGSGLVPGSPVMAVSAAPDHIEAAVRAGTPAVGERLVGRYLTWARAVGSAELGALAARSQALLAGSAVEAEKHYAEALRLHALADRPFDHARTELLYGEFLRRDRQRARARGYLRSAMDAFTRLGTPVWAERARTELRAAGETVGGAAPGLTEGLTPQELQVARAVARGDTNREVAAELFISPRTVDYHLRKVFRKLGISSRRDLMKLDLGAESR
ncbi:LuxR family transcriptional regulator [Amycolatopsis sp. NBC_00345]|uniref:helix-turn-helix transcriptional regulator n=1 Tax=Amycolatopsis sp. NBC_00345 TaxID=2975955 RepID=UPI002E2593E3